jgi:transcriptional regulator GlxA family with amidase domain
VLARTGALNGLKATTHWRAAAELARRYPKIDVNPDVLYVDNGRILTSAGAAAGLDLCLHLVRRNLGAEIAARTACLAVMPRNAPADRPSSSYMNQRILATTRSPPYCFGLIRICTKNSPCLAWHGRRP